MSNDKFNDSEGVEDPWRAPPPLEAGERTELDISALVNSAFSKVPQAQPHAENLVPRLGEYLVETGMLSRRGLKHALDIQRQRQQENRPVLLGNLLVELGYIEKAMLDRAVTMQVMALHRALADQNRHLEQKVAERTEQLEEALEQARRLQQHKDEFVGAISHELRTPLTLVLGYIDLFVTGDLGLVSPSQAKALNNMRQATDRLHELINNLLDFATGESRRLPTSYAPVSVSDLFRFAVKKNITPAHERGVRLLVGAPRPVPIVRADRQKIRWVVSELVDNAVKFNDANGKVRLIGRNQSNRSFHFLVEDNGPGIPRERLEEVFEPFRQLDGSTTRKAGGMGLGLTLARQIIEAHGSHLEIRSQPGKGTQVGFSLQLANESN